MAIVAFQGEHGAYSEEAAFAFFGKGIITLPCRSFVDIFHAVKNGEASNSMLPVENSIEGSVGSALDLLSKEPCVVEGEYKLPVHHCLISHPGATLLDIKEVYSHPQALGQCREFLEQNKWDMIPFYDTAGSVRMIKEENKKNGAGIASALAAEIYGMEVLAQNIETENTNTTRFLVLGTQEPKPTGKDKTSIVFRTKHQPGALLCVLQAFAKEQINLTKLESRPIPKEPWTYMFFLDCEGHKDDQNVQQALSEAKLHTLEFRVIGSYPQHP
ncbi:MAG: prephenate dehydratase [bacterium]|nr:prephenate dehydratase [bacterium]